MATTKVINDLIDLNQTGNTTALKGCVGTNAQQPATPTISVQYLVVGGGGGANGSGSGGGGAGGLSNGTIAVPNNTALNIVVGQGGLGVLNNASDGLPANQGQDSGFYTIQGQGGGAGVHRGNGLPGGSGAGAGVAATTVYSGGNSVSGQGNNGGSSSATWSAGGGGGSGAVGTNGISSQAGAGGAGSNAVALGIITQANGITASIGEVNGATLNFAGGGGGGGSDAVAGGNTIGGSGGLGGGGNGSGQCTNCPGGDATLNTGGGGGGSAAATVDSAGGSGGSGVVILKYASTATETIAGSLAGGITSGTTGTCDYPTTASILYQFEDNANNTCSGGTYDATAGANVSYSANGKYGKAVEFTASTASAADVITVPDAIANLIINDFTISFWMKPDNLNYASQGYVNPIGFQKGRRFYIDISSAGAISSYNGNSTLASANNTITTGSWFHVVYTQSSSTGRVIYVNGTLTVSDGTTADTTVYNPGSSENVIGGYKTSSAWGLMFDGLIDQFRLFPSVLTADQAAMLYAENVGATKFTESSDTVLVFKAGSGTINLTDTSLPGPKVGDLRTNTDQTSNSSASAMEHYTSTGWRVLTNTLNSTLSTLNYPPGKTAMAVYPLQTNTDDVSTNYNATNVSNNITFPGSNGFRTGTSAASFNESSSVGLMQNSLTAFALQEFTYSIWIKPAVSGNYGYIWSNYSNGGVGMGLVAQGWNGSSDKKVTFWWRNGGSANPVATLYSNGDLTTSAWQHVCVTYSNTTGVANIYINGDNVTLGSSTNLNSNQHPIAYGNLSSGGRGGTCFGQLGSHDFTSGFYNGLIQEIRIYDSALSSTDVGLLYTQQ